MFDTRAVKKFVFKFYSNVTTYLYKGTHSKNVQRNVKSKIQNLSRTYENSTAYFNCNSETFYAIDLKTKKMFRSPNTSWRLFQRLSFFTRKVRFSRRVRKKRRKRFFSEPVVFRSRGSRRANKLSREIPRSPRVHGTITHRYYY